MLEIIFSQILKMSLTAGVCIVVVSMLHLVFQESRGNICMHCGSWWHFAWSARCRSVHRWDWF